MSQEAPASYSVAVRDFRRARGKAALRRLLNRIGGGSPHLLPYEEVVRRLAGRETGRWELREIPIEAIVGSVGRYLDFTRDFLPLRDSDEQRWAQVKVAMTGLAGLPPIEVYQVGEAYFVLDGNHRVSVARQLGATYIQAYVNEVRTKAPLSPNVDLDELIIKGERAEFLQRTQLDESRPDTDLTVTAPGRYPYLEHQIRAFAASLRRPDMPLPKAAKRWHDQVYRPAQEMIRELGMLAAFPDRTAADLYVWITQHREQLQQALGWQVNPRSAAADLIARAGERIRTRARRARRPEPASPQRAGSREGQEQSLLSDILVPISGADSDWPALDQAELIAQREGGRVLGLHVARSERAAEAEPTERIRQAFASHCAGYASECRLAVEVGRVAATISDRARGADLVVVKLNYPPGKRAMDRLSSGFHRLISRSPRPVLAVPRQHSALRHALLAYDASAKAEEGLYLAAYLAARWEIELSVVSVGESRQESQAMLEAAEHYLSLHRIRHTSVAAEGEPTVEILRALERRGADLLITGGYGRSPVAEVVLGSTVDPLLREVAVPVLICN